MRDLFPGWVPPDEETLDHYWREATFAIDTSVLLDLYRFSGDARNGLLDALQSLEDRLWIPHQVGFEFHRNRFGVLLDQREAETKLLAQLDEIQASLDDQLSQRLRGVGRRDLAPLRDAVREGIESLRKKLQEAEKAHTKGLGESIQDDPVYEQVVELVGDRIGKPFDTKRQEEVIRDAEQRLQNEVPPGYLDANKDGVAKYGDVILWHQLCERAEDTEKPIVLIADDQKSDWVWEVRGKTLGPRPELVAEMKEKAKVGFHLYTPKRFLQIWEKRGAERRVQPEVWEEIESPSPPVQGGRSDLFFSALERSLEKSEDPIPLSWVERLVRERQKEQQGPASPIHRVSDQDVFLGLTYEVRDLEDPDGQVRVVIHRPDGSIVGSVAESVQPETAGIKRHAIAHYPRDFARSDQLISGPYRVVWEVLLPRGMPDAKRNDRLSAEDWFVV